MCPTFGPPYSVAGQIEKFVLLDGRGAERIRTGRRLAPCDPVSCFVAGYLDASEGKYDACAAEFARAVQLDGGLFKAVVDIYVGHLRRPEMAVAAAQGDLERLRYVAAVLEEREYADLAEQALDHVKDLLEAKCSVGQAAAQDYIYLGAIRRRRSSPEAAVECYRRALALNYGKVEWRLELAELLAETGRIPEAMGEARICLQLRPGSYSAQKLVGDLSLHLAGRNGAFVSP